MADRVRLLQGLRAILHHDARQSFGTLVSKTESRSSAANATHGSVSVTFFMTENLNVLF